MIEVINKHHKLPPTDHDVYIGRPGVLANQWSHLPNTQAHFRVETREEAVEQYEKWLRASLNVDPVVTKEMKRIYKLWQNSGNLRLVCWCAPCQCHGDVIKEILLEKALREK